MSKLKKIVFSDLGGKTNQKFIDFNDLTKTKFLYAVNFDEITKRIKMSDVYSEIENEDQLFSDTKNNLAVLGDSSMISLFYLNNPITSVPAVEPSLFTRTVSSNFDFDSPLFTFPAGTTLAECLISFKGLLIAITLNTSLYYSYSDDQGNTFTHTAWSYGNYLKHIIATDGYLYILDDTGKVLRSQDGITFEIFYNGATYGNTIVDLIEFDGFIYFLISSGDYNINHFCKYSNGILEYIKSFDNATENMSFIKFDNSIFLSNIYRNSIIIYKYNKSEVEEFARTDHLSFTGSTFLLADLDFIYFSAKTSSTKRYLYKCNKRGSISYIQDFGSSYNIISGILFASNPIFLAYINTVSTKSVKIFDNILTKKSFYTGASDPYILLPIFDFKHSPAFIRIRHDKLTANASVIIKANVNYGSTAFITPILSDTDLGSYVYTQDLKKTFTQVVNFLELAIFITDTDQTFGVNNLIIEYFYNDDDLDSF